MRTAVPAARRWPVISALGVVMIFTWGSTYYLMTVLALPIAEDTGWSLTSITGALSAGLLVAGLTSPRVGRVIARHGGRPVLAAGCAMISTGLAVIAIAPALWVFWAGWLILGLGMAAGLYDPAFASLGRLYGAEARSAITLLTLWGGFASTFCWPLSALMLDLWGWRGVAAAYAAIHLFVTLPLVLAAIPRQGGDELTAGSTRRSVTLSQHERLVFGLMAAMLVLNGLIVVNISTWLFAFLQAQGLSLATAVALGTLIGPAQVGARVLEMAGRERHTRSGRSQPRWSPLRLVSRCSLSTSAWREPPSSSTAEALASSRSHAALSRSSCSGASAILSFWAAGRAPTSLRRPRHPRWEPG
jgi:MFS family permease